MAHSFRGCGCARDWGEAEEGLEACPPLRTCPRQHQAHSGSQQCPTYRWEHRTGRRGRPGIWSLGPCSVHTLPGHRCPRQQPQARGHPPGTEEQTEAARVHWPGSLPCQERGHYAPPPRRPEPGKPLSLTPTLQQSWGRALSHRCRVTPCLCPSGPTRTRALPGRPPTLALPTPQVFRLTAHVVVRTLRPRGNQSQSFWDREATRGNPDLSSPTACVPRGQAQQTWPRGRQRCQPLSHGGAGPHLCRPLGPAENHSPSPPDTWNDQGPGRCPGSHVHDTEASSGRTKGGRALHTRAPTLGSASTDPLCVPAFCLPGGGWGGGRPGPGPQEATPILVEGRAALQAKPSLERRPMKLERRAGHSLH
ncbi:uncharacterized protein LOC122898827 [Neovison vison]|uniref:uncharacterized protein LOC122898827 n=1 Tax=Neovison vison TaxID=452646 RepID=UPI001CF06588|nr:uncharacterized protein LOC122898827 [Neogale vison]